MTCSAIRRPIRVSLVALILASCVVGLTSAASLAPTARDEINALLGRLAASGCQFTRNGTWYTAGDARAHLVKKLDYLAGRGAVASAEQFIERAATQSSVSGEAYAVKCGDEPARASSDWLRSELRALRANPDSARERP